MKVGRGKEPSCGHAFEGNGERELTKRLVPEKLERFRRKLYEKAKREPGFRFYSLYDKVCWAETLSQAYSQARANRGGAGVDGVVFEDIESSGVEQWLGELRKELVEDRYRPSAVRRVKIAKPDGGERPLGIPTIRDRVVQTAVVLILEPIFEADFEDNVYAYRPGRSAQDALGEVRERLYAGQTHVVDADVSAYFDTIPHRDLLQSVARRVADGKILRLLKLWLKSPVDEQDGSGRWRRTGGKNSKQGTPQGGVVSPLLANIYLNRLVRHWRLKGASQELGTIVSYADDFVILCRSRQQAVRSLALVTRWLAKLGLQIHPVKTRICFARAESFDFLGYTFGPRIHWRTGRSILSAVPSQKSVRRLKGKVNALLYRGNPTPWPELRGRLNSVLRGWANYFSFGWTAQVDAAIWWHLAGRARRFLCKRHKIRSLRTARFSTWEVYGSAGVLDICAYRRQRGAP